MVNYYTILGISKTADNQSIKRAFRAKAMVTHPDRNKSPNAHLEFLLLSEAYYILIDEVKRRVYDSLLSDFERAQNLTSIRTDPEEYKQYSEWVKEEKQRASKFANMNFEDFAKTLTKLVEGGVNVAYFGCAFYTAICFIVAGLISIFDTAAGVFSGEISGWVLILQVAWSILLSGGASYWIYRMLKGKK